MRRRLLHAFLFALILSAMNIAVTPTRAESPERRAALKLCRQKYKETMKGSKYLKGADRKVRMEAAREERRKCRELAPKR
ncbi:MAG TPA: hypothetical protein VFB82_04750 [Blastocatellia bacterium]|jgi:hypothetical protein|nr:hypothetical protein [Blastocatellia bacterium]